MPWHSKPENGVGLHLFCPQNVYLAFPDPTVDMMSGLLSGLLSKQRATFKCPDKMSEIVSGFDPRGENPSISGHECNVEFISSDTSSCFRLQVSLQDTVQRIDSGDVLRFGGQPPCRWHTPWQTCLLSKRATATLLAPNHSTDL